jgi:acyl-CoA thioester hydrolase
MIESRTELRVRYAETDMMGVVYHANYLAWFEVGRTELLRQHGLPYRTLEDGGFRLPVIEVGARYLRPAVYDDVVVITTRLREKPTVRVRLDYEVHARGQLLVTGYTEHAFINALGEPVKPPAAFVKRMNELFAGPPAN